MTRPSGSYSSTDLSRLLVLVPVTVTVCASISYPLVNVGDEVARDCYRLPPHTLAKCRYDEDCMDNAYCSNQEGCYCKNGYIAYKNRTYVECLKVADAMGDPCHADVQCHVTFTPRSECRHGICECSAGSHFAAGRCYESVGLGGICQTHHNCYIGESYCVSGFCACTLQRHPSPDGSECLKSVLLGEKCSMDDECVAENSRCIDVCVCKVDHVLSADGKRCLKAANSVGEPCSEDSQCKEFLRHSACGADGSCSCVSGFHRRGSVCLKNVGLRQRCVSHQQCVTQTYRDSNSTDLMNVDCVNGECICASDYTITEDGADCIRYSDNGTMKYQQTSIIFILVGSFISFAII